MPCACRSPGVGADAAHQLVEHREIVQEAFRAAALVGELSRHLLPPHVQVAEQVVLGDQRIVQHHFVEVVVPRHVDDRVHRDAGRVHRHQELAQPVAPVLPGGRGGAHQRDHVVGTVGVAGPHLASVEAPPVPDPIGPAAQREEIRSRIRLAHADAEVALSRRDPGQDVAADRLLRVAQQHRPALAVRYPVGPHRRAHREQLLGDHVALEEAAFSAPVLRRPGHADEAGRSATPAELRRVASREPSASVRHEAPRLHLAIDELAHPCAYCLRFGRQLHRIEAQRRLSHREASCSRRGSCGTLHDASFSWIPAHQGMTALDGLCHTRLPNSLSQVPRGLPP